MNNRITHLDKASFSGLNQLFRIDLSNNLIKSLHQDIFNNTSQLAEIILRRNQLTQIPAMMFAKLTYLTSVDLSQNLLASVSENAITPNLRYYNKFKHIDLSRNNLTDFPAWLFHIPFVVDINLSFNRLSFQSIEFALQKALDISEEYIIGSMHSIQTKVIKFQQNEFVEFEIAKMEQNSYLQFQFRSLLTHFRLDFGEEVFNCDCNMFNLYQYLYNFDIMDIDERAPESRSTFKYNKNGFSCLRPTELRGKPLIKAPIDALGCDEPLSSCPKHCRCWVRSVDGAVKVNCAHQNLTRLPDSIPDRIIELDFSYNKLRDSTHDFPSYLKSLHLLDLSYNDLEKVDGNLFGYNISDIRLHNNELITLPKEVSTVI